jgi:hypothetical protein
MSQSCASMSVAFEKSIKAAGTFDGANASAVGAPLDPLLVDPFVEPPLEALVVEPLAVVSEPPFVAAGSPLVALVPPPLEGTGSVKVHATSAALAAAAKNARFMSSSKKGATVSRYPILDTGVRAWILPCPGFTESRREDTRS